MKSSLLLPFRFSPGNRIPLAVRIHASACRPDLVSTLIDPASKFTYLKMAFEIMCRRWKEVNQNILFNFSRITRLILEVCVKLQYEGVFLSLWFCVQTWYWLCKNEMISLNTMTYTFLILIFSMPNGSKMAGTSQGGSHFGSNYSCIKCALRLLFVLKKMKLIYWCRSILWIKMFEKIKYFISCDD